MPDSLSQKMSDAERMRDAAAKSGESNTDMNAARRGGSPEKSRDEGGGEALRLADVAADVSLMGRLHQWWIFFVAGMLLVIFAPPTLLYCWLTNRRESLYPMAMWGARWWLRLSGMRVVVSGGEHLDPERGYIFIANHRSYLDTATLFAHTGRRIGLFAKKELLKVPILGYGMGYVNIMAIDRSNRERALETVRAATERIRSGISFGVFAEGTRARPGELLPFKKGAFYMALETGVPVVPVAIKHTDALMGKGTGTARAGTIEMVFLSPLATTGLSTDEDVRRLSAEVRERVAEELQR